MHASIGTRPAPNALLGLAKALAAAAATTRRGARALDRWLARRERAARDRAALAQMSDRDLADIGVSRGYLDFVASGEWSRDAR